MNASSVCVSKKSVEGEGERINYEGALSPRVDPVGVRRHEGQRCREAPSADAVLACAVWQRCVPKLSHAAAAATTTTAAAAASS